MTGRSIVSEPARKSETLDAFVSTLRSLSSLYLASAALCLLCSGNLRFLLGLKSMPCC